MSNGLLNPNLHEFLEFKDQNCTHGVQWIWIVFGQCSVTPREIAATSMGMISATIWLFFSVPQILENFRRGIPDQAISPKLLASFFIGDLCNLSGCLLTHQLILQTIVAVNSVACDIVQISQFIYYMVRHRRLLLDHADPNQVSGSTNVEVVPSTSLSPHSSSPLLCFVGFLCISPFLSAMFLSPSTPQMSSSFNIRTLLSLSTSDISPTPIDPPFFPTPNAYVGYVLGWISAITFCYARVPQIYKNWKRSSTEGLSLISFSLAVVGNVTYGLQIFLTSFERLYLLRSLPWIIGFPGVVILDSIMCAQFYIYRRKMYARLINDPEGLAVSSTSRNSSVSI